MLKNIYMIIDNTQLNVKFPTHVRLNYNFSNLDITANRTEKSEKLSISF